MQNIDTQSSGNATNDFTSIGIYLQIYLRFKNLHKTKNPASLTAGFLIPDY